MLVLMQLLKVLDKESILGLKEWMDTCDNQFDAEELAEALEDQGVEFTNTQRELFIQCILKKNYQFAFQFALREAV